MSRKKVGRYARKVRETVEKGGGVVSCCTTFNPCTAKLRINTKAVRHVKVAESHEKQGVREVAEEDQGWPEFARDSRRNVRNFAFSFTVKFASNSLVEIDRTDLPK